MPKSPKIAIITPVFNLIKSGRAEFIKQNIDSIHNQTYENLEHIIQDGASTDGTLEFLKEYADKGWIKLYSEKDKNVHDAINKAAKKTDAQYLGVLGSDDYYKDNDIIEHIVNNYLQEGSIEYIYGNEEQISPDDGSYIKTWYGNAHNNEFWRGVCFATGTMFFSKKIFEEVGMFDINYAVCSDMKLLMDFKFNDYKCAYCDKIVNVFRYGDGLSSSPYTKMLHTYEFSKICSDLWKNFDETITQEKAEYMIKNNEYSEEFLMKLRNYIIRKNLKSVDYVSFNEYIEGMVSSYQEKKKNFQLASQADMLGIQRIIDCQNNLLISCKDDLKDTINASNMLMINCKDDIKDTINASNTVIINCKDDLKDTINNSSNLLVNCKDDFKNTITEQIDSIKNEVNLLKEEMKKVSETEVNISFYPFKNLPLIKITEEIDSRNYYIFGKIPVFRVWKK